VRSYNELTAEGQLRRLRLLGLDAVAAYGIACTAVRIRRVAQSFNTTFRISDEAGQSFALRVGGAERIHADGTEHVEAEWMRALRSDGAVSPPDVIDAADGTPVVRRSHPGVDGARLCMLFGCVVGTPLARAMSGERAAQIGQLAALLHEHGAATAPPTRPSVLVADRVLYWRLENRLGQLGYCGSLISEALDRTDRVIAALWAHPPQAPHLLHGDLHPGNVMLSGPNLVPVDFQDLVWGIEVQDLAISLSSFRPFHDAETLRRRFRAGYASVRDWPEVDPETWEALLAARRLHQLNLALTLRRPGLDLFVARAYKSIGDWMD